MKKLSTTLALAIAFVFSAFCVDPAYENAMKKQVAAMKTIRTLEESQAVTNAFLRIAEAKPEEWLPLYYAAYLQTTAVFRFDVNKDQYLDQAMELVEKAEKVAVDNSEVTAMKGYVLMGKISIDPASRGQSLSPQVMQLYGKAIDLDRENPRALMLMAQMEQGMAQFFGQGPEKACGLARNALDLYAKEEAKVSGDYILPTWGKGQAEQVADACK
jgi:predicted GNAT family N-acyltransferase